MTMMTKTQQACAVLAFAALALVTNGDRATACGLFYDILVTASPIYPTDPAAFAAGDIGIVCRTFARRFLVQSYRALQGLRPGPQLSAAPSGKVPSAEDLWRGARGRVLKTDLRQTWERKGDANSFEFFENCGPDSLLTAARTADDRISRYGVDSADVRNWMEAQDVVFTNCGDAAAALPKEAPATAPAWLKADRAYQVAAAHFYAMHFAEAETRFLAIGADPTSPWRRYGRYLATRAVIRRATLATPDPKAALTLLAQADATLAGIATDPALAEMAAPATALRHFIAIRTRPMERTRELATAMAKDAMVSNQDLVDYTVLMNGFVGGDKVEYPFGDIKNRNALTNGNDLNDWVIAMQGTGTDAAAHRTSRWRATHAPHWLIAAMWNMTPTDADAPAALDDAAKVPPTSPAFPTVSFLRARLMINGGQRDAARAVLTALPKTATRGFPADAVNMIDALRFRTARSLAETLQLAVRRPLTAIESFAWSDDPLWSAPSHDAKLAAAPPVLDEDSATVFNARLPLARLVEAVTSDTLPATVRVQLAAATWVRAVILKDDTAGLTVTPVLSRLAPVLKDELARYTAATDATARHRSAILTILRWPYLKNYVRLNEIADDTDTPGWPKRGRHDIRTENWWCDANPKTGAARYGEPMLSQVVALSGAASVEWPEWLTPAERATAASQVQTMLKRGSAPQYLGDEAVAWAKAAPKDPAVAEALALTVTATNNGCTNGTVGPISKEAFTLLHQLFPNSTWAKQTKFWYDGK